MGVLFEKELDCKDESVGKLVEILKAKYTKIWFNSSSLMPALGEKTNLWQKLANEKSMNTFIDAFVNELINYPEDKETLRIWRLNIKKLLVEFTNRFTRLKNGEMNILFNNGISRVTEHFVEEARKFDPSMDIKDIGQAIRNVWIMNIIQMLLNIKPSFTPSIFAYSMLYPYTDNYLDDTTISKEIKIEISTWFEKVLEGEDRVYKNSYEKALLELVTKIEGEFPRSDYPQVYEGLLGIHSAQMESLSQQEMTSVPFDKDILGISIKKGGISVLTDAYLIKGKLISAEADFMFGYGVFLQLCDDLQDAAADLHNSHMTIFSQSSKKWSLDKLTNKLINFLADVIDGDKYYTSIDQLKLKSLIKENCLSLVFEAVSQNRKLYSKGYLDTMQQYSSYRFKYFSKLNNKLKGKYKYFNKTQSGTSLETRIFAALDENNN